MTRRILAMALALLVLAAAGGCASAKQTAKTMVQQGVETTSSGPHTVVPANNAENAVNAINGATQQSQGDQQQETGQ